MGGTLTENYVVGLSSRAGDKYEVSSAVRAAAASLILSNQAVMGCQPLPAQSISD